MIIKDKNIQSLIKKIQKKFGTQPITKRKYFDTSIVETEAAGEDATDIFREMKKLSFTELAVLGSIVLK
jgi:hypothetical protein